MTLVSYLIYLVIFCLLSVCSSTILACFFSSNWSQSCLCYFIFRLYLTGHSLLLLMIVIKLHRCPASASLPVTLQHCPTMLFWLFAFVHFGWSCIVCYFVYFVILCLLSVCSSIILACFILFQTGLSLACFVLFSEFTLIGHSLWLVMIVLQLHHCAASANLPVALPDYPATLFWFFCLCSFQLDMYCCSLLLIMIVLQLHCCPASASLPPCRFNSSASAVC